MKQTLIPCSLKLGVGGGEGRERGHNPKPSQSMCTGQGPLLQSRHVNSKSDQAKATVKELRAPSDGRKGPGKGWLQREHGKGKGLRQALSVCFGNSLEGGYEPWLPRWRATSIIVFLCMVIPASGPERRCEIQQNPRHYFSEKSFWHTAKIIHMELPKRTRLKNTTN